MTLVLTGILHHFNSEIKNKNISENYVNISKKILKYNYKIHDGCIVRGEITEINQAAGDTRESEMPREALNHLNVGLIYFEGKDDKDYLFLTKKLWNEIVGFAILPEEYELTLELDSIECGWRKTKLFDKGRVTDK